MAVEGPTFRALITSFSDFLTVATHTILYERSIYPQTSFLSARKYNFPVRQSRHPKVCEWINDAIAAVEAELLKGAVERIAVVIYDNTNKPLERFMFDVSHLPTIPAGDIDTPLERTQANGEKVAVLPTVDMEEQFRATMSKLANCGNVLKPLPKGCSFTMVVEIKGDGEAPISHPQPWMPVQSRYRGAPNDARDAKTTPLRTVSAGDMIFETWIEEAKD